jgi:hypothetical protein
MIKFNSKKLMMIIILKLNEYYISIYYYVWEC